MLRASSEIAVAMTARSVVGKPHFDASSRPFWREATMSASQSIGTRTSSTMIAHLRTRSLALAVKVGEPLFQIEGRRDALEREPELDHRKGNLRLDTHDDRLCSAEADHVRDVAEGARRERIDDVERGDVDDHPSRPHLADGHHERVAQLLEV